MQDYCETVGVNYVVPDNEHAKAGNLNNALEHTNALPQVSDFIMVLDADFAPQANFLRRVTGLFADPGVWVCDYRNFTLIATQSSTTSASAIPSSMINLCSLMYSSHGQGRGRLRFLRPGRVLSCGVRQSTSSAGFT